MIAQHNLPVQDKFSITTSISNNYKWVTWFTTRAKGKQGNNSEGIKCSFGVKTVACQYRVSKRCRYDILYSHVKSFISISTLCVIRQHTIPINPSWNSCQLVSNKEGEIVIWRDIPQRDICTTICHVNCCASLLAIGWSGVIKVMDSITQWFYFIAIEICKGLVSLTLGKNHCGVIFVRS